MKFGHLAHSCKLMTAERLSLPDYHAPDNRKMNTQQLL